MQIQTGKSAQLNALSLFCFLLHQRVQCQRRPHNSSLLEKTFADRLRFLSDRRLLSTSAQTLDTFRSFAIISSEGIKANVGGGLIQYSEYSSSSSIFASILLKQKSSQKSSRQQDELPSFSQASTTSNRLWTDSLFGHLRADRGRLE